MKVTIAIVATIALVLALGSVSAQISLVGQWGGEICETYDTPQFPIYARRLFSANETEFTLTLKFYLTTTCSGTAAATVTASGPYEFLGDSTATGCDGGEPVYDLTLFTNVTKSFVFTNPIFTYNNAIGNLCNWTDYGIAVPVKDQVVDIRNLTCATIGVASCFAQPQIVQRLADPTRLYFGSAAAAVDVPDPCADSERPTHVEPLGFILDLAAPLPAANQTTCFAGSAPVGAPTASGPIAMPAAPVAAPVGVPSTENINPVSAATRFVAVLGFFVALVLVMF